MGRDNGGVSTWGRGWRGQYMGAEGGRGGGEGLEGSVHGRRGGEGGEGLEGSVHGEG